MLRVNTNRSNELAHMVQMKMRSVYLLEIDPLCNVWDIEKDPVEFYDKR